MTRAEQITKLQQEIARTPKNKRKRLAELYARLHGLMLRQLNAELRKRAA